MTCSTRYWLWGCVGAPLSLVGQILAINHLLYKIFGHYAAFLIYSAKSWVFSSDLWIAKTSPWSIISLKSLVQKDVSIYFAVLYWTSCCRYSSSFVLRRAIKQQISICLIHPSSADGWLKEPKQTTVMHKIGVALLKTQS